MMSMKPRFTYRIFVYFLCVSFLLLTNGFHSMVAAAKEIDRPIGEMISRGEVKFQSMENVWKDVEPSHFPIFQGVGIRTGKGASIITLKNNSHIEVGQNSLLSFDRNDQMHLNQGTINFRFPSTAELSFKVGNLTVIKYRSLNASNHPLVVEENGDIIGSIRVHPNGSVTVKSTQGSLSVVNPENVVLAALSSKDTVTIPFVTANSSPRTMVAQSGETSGTAAGSSSGGEFLGLSTETWLWVGGGVVLVGAGTGIGIAVYENNKSHHHEYPVVCP
jgi:hypothetical protein